MENAQKYASFIKRIVTTTPALRKQLLKSSNLQIIRAICEILLNIYYKRINVSKQGIQHLKRHKRFFVKLLSKNTSLEKRKQLLLANSDSIVGIAEIFK